MTRNGDAFFEPQGSETKIPSKMAGSSDEGSLESEDFPILRRTKLSHHDLNPEMISRLHRDTLYVFSA